MQIILYKQNLKINILPQNVKTTLSYRFNEKFGCVKTQVNYDTISLKEGLFTNGCKKTLKLVQNAIKIMYKNEV